MTVDPHNLLAGVHPDLARVIKAAAQTPVRFQVVYGLRTTEAEAKAVATGHSQSMHSRHLPQKGGKACAVDICVVDANGKLDWAVSNTDGGNFGEVAKQIKAAAASLNIPLEWGGDKVGAWAPGVVSHFRDWGHFQLPWAQYP